MRSIIPKYKIYNQTQENVNDIIFPQKLTSKKWRRLSRNLNSPLKVRINKKPKSLKRLYKQRLLDRQKFKTFYGLLTNTQLKKQYKIVKTKYTTQFFNHLISRLESRIDVLLWRSRLFKSLYEIHQKINHGFIKINNQQADKKNMQIKPGDFIWVDPAIQRFYNNKTILPNHVEWSKRLNIIVLIKKPLPLDAQYSFKYSRILIFNYLNNK
jgi:ribosomal protein S4